MSRTGICTSGAAICQPPEQGAGRSVRSASWCASCCWSCCWPGWTSPSRPLFYVAVAGFLLFYGLQAPHGALATLIRLRRTHAGRHPQRRPARPSRIPDAPPQRAAAPLRREDAPPGPPRRGRRAGRRRDRHATSSAYVGIGVTARPGASLYTAALVPYLRGEPARARRRRQVLKARRRLAARVPADRRCCTSPAPRTRRTRSTCGWRRMEQLEARPLIILRERVHRAAARRAPRCRSSACPAACT